MTFVKAPKDEGEAIAMQRDNAISAGMLPFAEQRFQKTCTRVLNQVTLKLDKGTLSEKDAWLAWAEVAAALRLMREIKAQQTAIDPASLGS